MRKLIFIFIIPLVLFGRSLNAQKLIITTDYENCGVGLKDTSGNWVLQPVYTQIEYKRKGYKLLQGDKEGFANKEGVVIIPPIYDIIRNLSTNAFFELDNSFIVQSGKKQGAVDSTGKIFIPIEYNWIELCRDSSILAYKGKKETYIYQTDGSFIRLHARSSTRPKYCSPNLYVTTKYQFRFGLHHIFNPYYDKRYKFGLVTSQGQILQKRKYNGLVEVNHKTKLIAAYTSKEVIFIDATGKEKARFDRNSNLNLISDFRYAQEPLSMNETNTCIVRKGDKFGIINGYLDTVLPLQYEKIISQNYRDVYSYQSSYYLVKRSGKYGLYNPYQNKWEFTPDYDSIEVLYYYGVGVDSSLRFFALLTKNEEKNLAFSDGWQPYPYHFKSGQWLNKNYVMMREDGAYVQISFPFELGLASIPSHLQIIRHIPNSGKWQTRIMADSTYLIINADTSRTNRTARAYKGLKSSFADVNTVANTAIVIRKINNRTALNNTTDIIYLTPIGLYRTGQTIDSIAFMVEHNSLTGENKLQDLKGIYRDKKFTYYKTATTIVRNDGKKILDKKLDSSNKNEWNYSTLNTSFDGMTYILTSNLLDYTFLDYNGEPIINLRSRSQPEYIGDSLFTYSKVQPVKKRKHDPDDYNYWHLIDAHTGRQMLPVGYLSDQPAQMAYQSVIVSRYHQGVGIYNFTKKGYTVPPIFDCIRKLDSAGVYFVVRTCSGKIGIMDYNGNTLIDTSWTAMFDANYDPNAPVNDNNNHYYNTVVLTSQGQWIIFATATGKTYQDRAIADSLLFQAFALKAGNPNYYTSKPYRSFPCRYCPMLDTNWNASRLASLPRWQHAVLFDSLFAYQTFDRDSLDDFTYGSLSSNCPCKSPWKSKSYYSCHDYIPYNFSKEYEFGTYFHDILFSSDSCLSVIRRNNNFPKHFTVMLYPDGPHSMLLDSLFTGTAWKNWIITEVMDFLKAHPGVQGNCSNPAYFPIMLQNHFLIVGDKLLLYPPGYRYNYIPLAIEIPLERAKPYLKEEVKGKLGVK
jgi:WG containing repeat